MTSSFKPASIELAEHVNDLQTRLTFQEDALHVMSEQMALQAHELQTVRQQVLLLNQKLNDLFYQLEQRGEPLPNERPPHY